MTKTAAFPDRIRRGLVDFVSDEELKSKCARKKSLRIKLGVDPTSPDLHLGHTVTLNKLRQFQEEGHRIVFIIGDYTALIGDPSGRSETRPPMSPADVEKNTATYLQQLEKTLSVPDLEVRRNSEWLRPLFANQSSTGPDSILSLLSRHTVQQLTERDDFTKRLKEGKPLSLLELLYPLLQGYYSVAVRADVELGGTDQLFNLLMGRQMQKDAGQEPQVIMTLPLLEGTDGVRKMSKSYGNTIALTDTPDEKYGKIMAVSDTIMWKYFELLTEENLPEMKALHPMEAKHRLAQVIVARYHGTGAAEQSRVRFQSVFSKREMPSDMPEHRVARSPVALVDLLVEAGTAPSKNEARRLIRQGAVELDGERLSEDQPVTVDRPRILKVGKKQFRKVSP